MREQAKRNKGIPTRPRSSPLLLACLHALHQLVLSSIGGLPCSVELPRESGPDLTRDLGFILGHSPHQADEAAAHRFPARGRA